MSSDLPIGVFDSGIGGVSVLRQIRALLPHEDLVYVADTAHVPYGDKPVEFIEQRALAVSEFLLCQPVKAIVVACNTATAAAVHSLRARYKIPILGMEPAVKPAVGLTRSDVVGVLATSGTLNSRKFSELVQRFGHAVEVLNQPCPGLVERIEAGQWDDAQTRELLRGYLEPLLARGADAIALGCTHYPFLTPLIGELAGPQVSIIDTGPAVARHLAARLEEVDALSTRRRAGGQTFYVTGDPQRAQAIIARLWREPFTLHALAKV